MSIVLLKIKNPEEKIICPRCGKKLIYKRCGNSVAENVRTKDAYMNQ